MKTEPDLKSRDFLWFSLAAAPILAIACLLPVYPNDYWWYLRLGGEILSGGSIPQVETWSATQAGEPVVYQAWLAALVFLGLDWAGGVPAVVLARGLSLGVFYASIFLASRRVGAGARLAAGLVVLAALVGSSNWGVRPQVFTYPLFGLALLILVSWHMGRYRWLWLLPFITLLWVNLHGSFPLVFLLASAALVSGTGDRRRLSAVLAVMVLAALLNPRGWGAWGYFWQMLSDPSVRRFSSEWKPAALVGWQSALFFAWLLAGIPLAAYSIRRLPPSYWLWWLGFGWLALSGVRNVIWFSALLAVLSAALLVPLLSGKPALNAHPTRARINYWIGSILLFLTFLFLPGVRERWWAQAPPPLSPDTPVQAVGWLETHPELKGRMWNDLTFSSYLIYALPEQPVWIDTRFEVYPPERWERYQEIAGAGQGWQERLVEEEIDLVVANREAQSALIGALQHAPGWCLRYEDSTTAIFSRSGPGSGCPEIVVGRQDSRLNP
ncbi:MAG TPA: hypothetical protein VI776_01580 [Anaerolineales bacterium]|nr:hypothetical protein [Anaerolineales bacterium]